MTYQNRRPSERSNAPPSVFVPPPGKDLSPSLGPDGSTDSPVATSSPRSALRAPSSRSRPDAKKAQSIPSGPDSWPKSPAATPSMNDATSITGDLFTSLPKHRRCHSDRQKVHTRVTHLERKASFPKVPSLALPSSPQDSQVVRSLIQARHVQKTIAKFAPADSSAAPDLLAHSPPPPLRILPVLSSHPNPHPLPHPNPHPLPHPAVSTSSHPALSTSAPSAGRERGAAFSQSTGPSLSPSFLTWSSPSAEEMEVVQSLWSNGFVKQNVLSFQDVITKSLESDLLPPAAHRKEVHSRPDGGCSYCGCQNFKSNFFNPTFCSFCFHIHPPSDVACISPRSLETITPFSNDISDDPANFSPLAFSGPPTPRGSSETSTKIYETLSAHVPNFSIERAKDQTDIVNMTTAFLLQAKVYFYFYFYYYYFVILIFYKFINFYYYYYHYFYF